MDQGWKRGCGVTGLNECAASAALYIVRSRAKRRKHCDIVIVTPEVFSTVYIFFKAIALA